MLNSSLISMHVQHSSAAASSAHGRARQNCHSQPVLCLRSLSLRSPLKYTYLQQAMSCPTPSRPNSTGSRGATPSRECATGCAQLGVAHTRNAASQLQLTTHCPAILHTNHLTTGCSRPPRQRHLPRRTGTRQRSRTWTGKSTSATPSAAVRLCCVVLEGGRGHDICVATARVSQPGCLVLSHTEESTHSNPAAARPLPVCQAGWLKVA